MLEAGDPAGRVTQNARYPALAYWMPIPTATCGFPGRGRAEQNHVLRLGQERARARVRGQVPVGGGLPVAARTLTSLMAGEQVGRTHEDRAEST